MSNFTDLYDIAIRQDKAALQAFLAAGNLIDEIDAEWGESVANKLAWEGKSLFLTWLKLHEVNINQVKNERAAN